MFRTYGICDCTLLYVIRDSVEIPDKTSDPPQLGCSYGQSDSFLEKIITRLEHVNPILKSDNASVYPMMKEAAQGTVYDPTIKPYAGKKNGRAAWKSMVSSHAGQDKRLEKFVGIHQNSFVQLQEAADHLKFKFPIDHSTVVFLIDNMSNSDPDLRAAIASVCINTINMCDYFEGYAGL